MEHCGLSLRFELEPSCQSFCNAKVTIPACISDKAYQEAVLAQKESARAQGFNKRNIPIEYVKQNFEGTIKNHLEEFLFKYFTLNFLLKEIKMRKINIASDPRITKISVVPGQDVVFNFDISLFPKIEFQNWKYYPFKAPKRKNYKDLDRQVENFMKLENRLKKENIKEEIDINDWVFFDTWVVNEANQPIFGDFKENLILKIGNEEADREFQKLFVGKKVDDIFYARNDGLQEYFGNQIGSNYKFGIRIKNIINNYFFCFEKFKRQFRLKTKKEIARRLIEVFSFRNDLSQRQAMVEEAFKLMFKKYMLDIPSHLVLRQQQKILYMVRKNPDYHVYKNQKNFNDHITKLANKQIKELILIDQLANKENIYASDEDIYCYLNLTKRPRMKEFIYFKMPETKIAGQEIPISAELIRQQCLREKTLNYIIYHFTRK